MESARATNSVRSPPPCGEGLGVGVVRCGDTAAHFATPLPTPPPQGGREQTEFAARLCIKLKRTCASRRSPRVAAAVCALAALMAGVTAAAAHGFGQRYDLPLPLSLYLWGTAAAVAVSFVIVGLFVRHSPRADAYSRVDLLGLAPARLIARPGVAFAIKLLGVALFIVTVVAGLRGDPNAYRNIAPTLVWIIWWVGLAYVSAFLGNAWALINPWNTLFGAAEVLWTGFGGRALSLRRPYPPVLGVWPAFVLLAVFAWIELVYPSPAVPKHIACFAIAYSILTFAGMALFGRETWLKHGEVFSLVFGTFARFAPTDWHRRSPNEPEWELRPFGAGLLDSRAVSTSMMAFVLLLLATVLYDGALGTPEWASLESPLAARLSVLGGFAAIAIKTAGLVLFWVVLCGAYVAACALMSVAAGGLPPVAMARRFALTLVPIAIGYHLAHYLTYLLVQGQYIIPLISDPFGFGWDLFGTAGYRVDIAVVGARFSWYAAVTAILAGHVAAVYLAHLEAMRIFPARALALRSQVPLTALMVAYTFVSLSILAEPIVERRPAAQPSAAVPAEVSVPPDAVMPQPGDGRLRAVDAGTLARQKLTYRMLGSLFHDGTRMSPADILYAYMFAYRWGARGEGDHYDPSVDAATAALRAHLAGVKVIATDTTSKTIRFGDFDYVRELLVVDIYITSPPIDPEQDAAIAPPWSTLPWQVIVLMEEAVTRGLAAFSQGEAARRGVPWLDLARAPELSRRLLALAEGFAREGYRPERLQGLVSADQARARWSALAAFYKEHGHFLVTNGPYRLTRWSPDGVVLDVFRDLTYPLGVGSYDVYAVPRRGYITSVERTSGRIRLSGDIETVMKFQRDFKIVREPLASVATEVRARAAPECRYTVIDDAGRLVLAGTVHLDKDAACEIDVEGRLPAGRYTIFAMLIVNGNAMNADVTRIPITVPSSP